MLDSYFITPNKLCINYLLYRRPGAMERRSFSRASSLPDLAATASSYRSRTGSAIDVNDRLHIAGSSTTAHGTACFSASGALGSHGSSEEDGLALLIHGSPISDAISDAEESEAGGLQLLDYESEPESRSEIAVQPDYLVQRQNLVAMNTEPPPVDSGNSAPEQKTMPEMDAVYYQCRSARTSMYKDILVSVSQDESFGKKINAPSTVIGSLEANGDVTSTFHGSCVMRGNDTVNQSVSCSFDPATLVCLSCNAEHPVFCEKPSVILMSDQNFVPKLGTNDKNCIQVVRSENASLIELFELAVEMFENATLAEGSILLFGSVSHLSRCGTSLYARDWTEVVALTSRTWQGIRICPLLPLITTECPRSVIRELSELAVWFESVYGTDPQGLHGTWMRLVAAMETCSTGTTSLDVMETYKIVMPSNLQCGNLNNVVTYCSHNSRPVTCNGLPKDSCDILLSSMLQEIHENFRACQGPEVYLARADGKTFQSEKQTELRVLLVGASNLKHSVPHFADTTMLFANITTSGWMATAENVKNLETSISSRIQETDAFVFDLLGNSSIRFEQSDGTTALPFKSNGRFHLGGDVVVTPPDIFLEVVKKVIPLFRATGDKPCVIIPPLPRYMFTRCCNDTDHCTNASEPNFCKTLLSRFIEIRNSLIRQLVSAGLTNFRVMDTCCTTVCPVTACVEERIKGLRSVTAKDGVHFVDVGYKNLAGRSINCLSKMIKKRPTTLLGPNPEKQVTPPLFSGEASEACGGLLATKNPKGHEDPGVLPWGSPEVGRLPPEVGRGPPTASCTMVATRTTIRIGDGKTLTSTVVPDVIVIVRQSKKSGIKALYAMYVKLNWNVSCVSSKYIKSRSTCGNAATMNRKSQ